MLESAALRPSRTTLSGADCACLAQATASARVGTVEIVFSICDAIR